MMNNKKKFILIIILIIVFTFNIVGCRKNDKITLIIKTPTLTFKGSALNDVDSVYDFFNKVTDSFINEYSNEYNLDIKISQYANELEYNAIDSNYDTNNACDILFNDYFTMKSHIYSGRVISLDDIISNELRNDIDDRFWNYSKINNKTYMMPYLYRQNVLMYNTIIFEEAGLSKYINKNSISTWSLDEWDYILKTLRSNMNDLSYPMMMYSSSNQGDTHIMSLIRSRGAEFFDLNDRINIESFEGIEALKWIKECIDNKIMPEYADEIDILDNYSLFKNNQLGIFMCNASSEKEFSNYGLVNFPSLNSGYKTEFLTGFMIFDNNDERKIELAKKYLKYIYESNYLDYSTSAFPVSNKIKNKYNDFLMQYQKYLDNDAEDIDFYGNVPNWLDIRNIFYKYMQKLIRGEMTPDEMAKSFDKEANSLIDSKSNYVLHK